MLAWLAVLLLLPATILLVPFITAALFGLLLAASAMLLAPGPAGSAGLHDVAGLAQLFAFGFLALVGLGALWLLVLPDSSARLQRVATRRLLSVLVLLGILAAVRWLAYVGGGTLRGEY